MIPILSETLSLKGGIYGVQIYEDDRDIVVVFTELHQLNAGRSVTNAIEGLASWALPMVLDRKDGEVVAHPRTIHWFEYYTDEPRRFARVFFGTLDLKNFQLLQPTWRCVTVAEVEQLVGSSSSGLGHFTLTEEIAGSTPAGPTNV